MRPLALALLAACAAACLRPLPAAPRAPRLVRVAYAVCEWDSYNAALIRRAARFAREAGVAASEVPCVPGTGAWRVVDAALDGYNDGECDRARREIRLDPARIPGAPSRVHVALHELLHAASGEHICRYPGELPDARHPNDRCSPVGFGEAVLNPYYERLSWTDRPVGGAYGHEPGFIALEHPTDLDRAEIARASALPLAR